MVFQPHIAYLFYEEKNGATGEAVLNRWEAVHPGPADVCNEQGVSRP